MQNEETTPAAGGTPEETPAPAEAASPTPEPSQESASTEDPAPDAGSETSAEAADAVAADAAAAAQAGEATSPGGEPAEREAGSITKLLDQALEELGKVGTASFGEFHSMLLRCQAQAAAHRL